IPSLNWGDMTACVAALTKAETRMQRLAERYGRGEVRRAMYATLDRTEALTRTVLSQLPQGSYTFTEYFEDDYVSDVPVRIVVKLTVRGDGTIELDYTGSDPQVRRFEPADRQYESPPVPRDVGSELCGDQIRGDPHQRRHFALHRPRASGSVCRQCQLPGGVRHALHDGDAGARSRAGRVDKGDPGQGAGRGIGRPRGHLYLDLGIGRRRSGRRREPGLGRLRRERRARRHLGGRDERRAFGRWAGWG